MFIFDIKKRPFVIFLPFLLLYILIVMVSFKGYIESDEARYYQFATNILNGFYSPPPPNINLWNGPGYPLLLLPFVYFKAPLICLVLTNAVAQYLSVVFLYKSLYRLVNIQLALGVSIFWALYFNNFRSLPFALTEPFACLLITGFIYNLFLLTKKGFIYAGLILGLLALTKIIFGLVLLISLVTLSILYLIRRHNHYKHLLIVLAVALLTNLPYLWYTYSITNKIFYWGNSGGMSLYWMSSPYTLEFGDWQPASLSVYNYPEPSGKSTGDIALKLNHLNDIKEVNRYSVVKQDSVYKALAIRNIKANPKQFLKNCLSNISRMLFDAPYSYKFQSRTILYSCLLGSLILFTSIFCSIYTIINWKPFNFIVKFLLLIAVIYLCLSTVVSAYSRMLDIIIPVLLIWFAFVLEKSIKINFFKRAV